MDINCGSFMLRTTKSAIDQGKVKEEELDRALLNLFSVQIRLGLFDGHPREGKYGELGAQSVCTSQHKTLALEAARQGIVLLKNENRFLPLNKQAVSSLSVIGSLANDASKLLGAYAGGFFCFISLELWFSSILVVVKPYSLFHGIRSFLHYLTV